MLRLLDFLSSTAGRPEYADLAVLTMLDLCANAVLVPENMIKPNELYLMIIDVDIYTDGDAAAAVIKDFFRAKAEVRADLLAVHQAARAGIVAGAHAIAIKNFVMYRLTCQ